MLSRRCHVGLRYRSPAILAVVLALVFTCVVAQAASPLPLKTEVVGPRLFKAPAPGGGTQLVPELAVAGQALVQVRPGTTPAELAAALRAEGCVVLRAIPHTPLVLVGLPEGMSVSKGLVLLSAQAVVAAAEPNRILYPTLTPNDPLYADQYHWPRIYAPQGWDVQTGAASTIVAVIDSGYDPDHPDLVSKYWVNQTELAGTADTDDDDNGYVDDIHGWDFYYDDNDPDANPGDDATPFTDYLPDVVSHGIHCAGLVGAATNNAEGVAGHDWACQLMMLRVFDPLGNTTVADVVEAVQYAIDNGADVISLSMGGAGYVSAFDPVFGNAHAAGVVLVVAAGNESHVFTSDPETWYSPVCNDGPNLGVDNYVLGVAATDQSDMAADFTNTDASGYNFVDVCAPGVDILSTWYNDPDLFGLQELYGDMSGTSMSCPIVAGLAALVRAHFPAMSNDEVVRQIRESCDDISSRNPLIADTLGEGRINTAGAMGLDVPPDPVSNLQAVDTPNDEGGSITVTWKVPPQDRADVQGYKVLRAAESRMIPGTPGSFTQIAQLPPGSGVHIDTPVPDHTPYWYQVVVFDASNQVPSAIAGPAEARDDTPPDPIENLVAADTQADLGGSISLSWIGYQYPDDLAEYRIYRATAAFTDVADLTPIATVLPGHGQHYQDTTTEDGVQYWYAVTAVDDEGNENTQVTTAGPVVSNPNFSFNYPPGLSIVAVPAVPAAPQSNRIADILGIGPDDAGDIDLASWDPLAEGGGAYTLWSQSPQDASFTQALGRAWWLRSDRPLLVNIAGQAAPAGEFAKPVVAGWNLWGNPFTTRLDFGATQVTGIGQGTPVSLQTSNQLGFTRDYAWAYDPFSNSFKLISAADLPFATNVIEPGRGVFFLAKRPATLLLQRQGAPAAQGTPVALDGWSLRLVAEAAGAADTDNFLGVSAQAAQLNGVVSPPRPDGDLELYFVRPGAAGGRLATDFVPPAAEARWQIKVACATPGATVRLSWPDLSELPADCRPILVDEDSGRSIYLRTSTGYSYEVGDEPTERNFTLRIADGDAGTLTISALSAIGGSGGAQVAYTLSEDAAVTVEVLNVAGRVVQRLAADRAQTAGPQQLRWDGRSLAGSAAPAGTYLVRILARGADGQQVGAVRSIQLAR